uniref:Uncharacterized protein n=1 Tax=Chrysotila carterae TaxID=13221 RepID=A0A7S4BTR1_CHRCT
MKVTGIRAVLLSPTRISIFASVQMAASTIQRLVMRCLCHLRSDQPDALAPGLSWQAFGQQTGNSAEGGREQSDLYTWATNLAHAYNGGVQLLDLARMRGPEEGRRLW